MMRRTHAATGLALGLGLSYVQQETLPAVFVFTLITELSALLPDLDIRLHLKHRGVTHSLLCWAVISLLTWYANPRLLLPIGLGYGSHLILDWLTVWGIPLFWPLQKRFRLMRISTGGRVDSLVAVAAFCGAIWAILLMLQATLGVGA